MSARRRIAGFSLLEVSVVLAVLGLLAVGFTAYWASAERASVARAQQQLMVRAERALVGFIYETGRLPCPAQDHDGREACGDPAQKGLLPWRTLGLPTRAAGELRYGVYRNPDQDLDLARAADRFNPLLTDAEGTPSEPPLGNANMLDLCFALDRAAAGDTDPALLHTSTGGTDTNVAYAIAAPGLSDDDGDGSRFDGRQASGEPVFDAPSRGASAVNDDRVATASFDGLAGYFDCAEALAAIGHTHFNAANSARMMAITSAEYLELLRLQLRQAEASTVSASAGVAAAAGGLASGTADTALAIAQTIGSYGTLSPIIAAGVASVVTNTSATVTAAAGLGAAIAGVVEAERRVERAEKLVPDAVDLAESIRDNALDADARGF